jgi:SAM-dependent methyltransferase
MADIEAFYDQLADVYPFIYQDWETSLKRQAAALDTVLREHADGKIETVLDAACGIGTQTIGLAELGYELTGADISQAALDRAVEESLRRGLDVSYHKCDMRRIDDHAGDRFDAVIACDNALPHLLSEGDISEALRAFHGCLRPGGLAVISMRDYAGMPNAGQQINPRQVHVDGNRKLILFDVWAFEGEFYDLTLYLLDDPGQGSPSVRAVRGARYYCIGLGRVQSLMSDAGFREVIRLDQAYFQPIVIGRAGS